MVEITELKIGSKVHFDKGIGVVVSLSGKEFANWNGDDDYTIVVEYEDTYYKCTQEEIHLTYS